MTAQAAAARAQANPTVIAMIAPARAAPAPANQTATHGTAPALAAIVTDRMSGADAPNPEADGPDADGPRSCIFITGNNRNGGNNDGLPRLCERYTMRTARRVQVGLRDTGCGSNAVLCPAFDAGAFPLAQMGSASDIQTNPRLGVATGMNGLCRSSARPIAISCLPLKVDLAEGQTIGIDCLFSAAAKSGGNYFGFVTISHDGENIVQGLIDVKAVGGSKDSGWQHCTFKAKEAGGYEIGIGVVDVGSSDSHSLLLVDNVWFG
jgi:hypothetical protein